MHHSDYHATLLKLFGFDHQKLACPHTGRQLTLTDGQTGQVVESILAQPPRGRLAPELLDVVNHTFASDHARDLSC